MRASKSTQQKVALSASSRPGIESTCGTVPQVEDSSRPGVLLEFDPQYRPLDQANLMRQDSSAVGHMQTLKVPLEFLTIRVGVTATDCAGGGLHNV